MSVRTMRQNLDEAYDTLLELRHAFTKQYWYCHPMNEGADVSCYLCGRPGKEHIESKHGYLCPAQPQEAPK